MVRLPSKDEKSSILQLDPETTVGRGWLVLLKHFYEYLFTKIKKSSETHEYTFESINQAKLSE